MNCPDVNSQTYTTHWHETFTIACDVDYTGGLAADGGGEIIDILGAITYSLEDCIEACSSINYQSKLYGFSPCKSITWLWDIKNATASFGGNCWLKNGTLATGTTGNPNIDCVSAFMN